MSLRDDDDRPVLVLQHLNNDGPAYLATWLRAQGLPFEVFNTEAGQAFPSTVQGYRALAVLGGEISANDDLDSLRQAERLILLAMDGDTPVLGHCLGGQLMARALGARVVPSPAPEVGWHALDLADTAATLPWFGAGQAPRVFQWHNEAFQLPAQAVALASSAACPHQAFSIGGRHLAMQFHVEIDAGKLAAWSASRDPAYLQAQRDWASVHSGERMRAEAADALPAQQRLADRVYRRWLSGR